MIVRELAPLERFISGGIGEDEGQAPPARVHRLPVGRPSAKTAAQDASAAGEEDVDGVEVGSSMRAVAPPIQSFAMGRRR